MANIQGPLYPQNSNVTYVKAIIEASIKVIQDLLPPISQRGHK